MSASGTRSLLFCKALRESLREHGLASLLRTDLLSAAVVGIIALPLSMALAIATGMPPQAGIFTAIAAGFVIALAGGSRVQVSGPTAAFVVILAPVVGHHGPAGLLMATLGAGIILLLAGFLRLGRLVEFIPNPVTAGFTAGIATVIALIQVKDFLGLQFSVAPDGEMPAWRESNVALIQETLRTLGGLKPGDAAIGVATLLMLLLWPKAWRRVPSALVVLPLAAVGAALLAAWRPDLAPATIDSRFGTVVDGVARGGIPRGLPSFMLPWQAAGAHGQPFTLDWEAVRTLVKYSFAIAMLGAIESLLSAVVADAITGRRHDPDAELVGQGLGNLVAPFVGGFAATGALARTAANVRAGARSPLSAMVHSVFLVVAVVAMAPWLGYLPMASLAGLLLIVARNMSDLKHCIFVVRRGPRGDAAVLILCFGLTVAFDMVIAVAVGVVAASLLFMRRMADLSAVDLGEGGAERAVSAERGILYYRVKGPLFFGAAQRAMNEVQVTQGGRVAVLDMEAVPMMDATGLINLESAVERLHIAGIAVILCGVGPRPMEVLRRAGFEAGRWRVTFAPDRRRAMEVAQDLVTALAAPGGPQAHTSGH